MVAVCDLPSGSDQWPSAAKVAREIRDGGGEAIELDLDVSSAHQVDAAILAVMSAFGRLDIVVNNAGAPQGADFQPTRNVPTQAWQHVIDVNLTGTFLVTRAAIPSLCISGATGRVVNMSSVIGRVGVPSRAAYAASKAGIIALTQVVAQELAPFGVTVNAVCPGMMLTGRALAFAAQEGGDASRSVAAAEAYAGAHIPIKRSGRPSEIADLVAFLCSDAAGYITGEAIGIDGGMKTVPVTYDPAVS
jgi:NAD(P)-dependent dehydrogenase (short-subunit alcohol dehydrogenase family)